MTALFALAKSLFGSLSLCSLGGAIVGALAGFLFGMLLMHNEIMLAVLTPADLFQMGVILGLVGWVILLVIFGLWLKQKISAIAAPALVTALVTALLTVFINNLIGLPAIAPLIGLAIGILVGVVLCWFCRWGRFSAGERHG